MEEEGQVPTVADDSLQRRAQRLPETERGHRLARSRSTLPKIAEARQVKVSVDKAPLERQDDQVAEESDPATRWRAVGKTEVLQQFRRERGEPPSRRSKTPRPHSELVHLVDAPFQQTSLVGRAKVRPVFVAPAMVGELVAGAGDLQQCLGVELGIQP